MSLTFRSWKYVLPTTLLIVIGVTICYVCIINIMLGSVPVNVKSMCGGLVCIIIRVVLIIICLQKGQVNTAFQIGSGVALALASAVVNAVDVQKGHDKARQYSTGLWCCVGLGCLGCVVSLFTMKGTPAKVVGASLH